jgi:N-acetylmuramoyl-L-alanine amidase
MNINCKMLYTPSQSKDKKMATQHTVVQGDCLATIAKKYGFFKWQTIYDHPNNASFRKNNPDPSCLQPDSSLYIPDKKIRGVEAAGRGKLTFVAEKPKVYFVKKIQDNNGNPIADAHYDLTIGKTKYSGKTDSNGRIEQEISIDEQIGELTIQPNSNCPDFLFTWKFKIGHLDTTTSATGHQARLQHNRIDCGPVDGEPASITQAAISKLQIKNNMTPNGEVSQQTASLLHK